MSRTCITGSENISCWVLIGSKVKVVADFQRDCNNGLQCQLSSPGRHPSELQYFTQQTLGLWYTRYKHNTHASILDCITYNTLMALWYNAALNTLHIVPLETNAMVHVGFKHGRYNVKVISVNIRLSALFSVGWFLVAHGQIVSCNDQHIGHLIIVRSQSRIETSNSIYTLLADSCTFPFPLSTTTYRNSTGASAIFALMKHLLI